MATDESYKDRNGERQKRTSFEILASNFRMLGGRAEGAAAAAGATGGGASTDGPDIDESDIPF